jgi:Tfp pilus assembly protein PilN
VPLLAISFVIIGWSSQHSQVAAKRAQVEVLRASVPAKAPAAPAKPIVDTSALVASRTARLAAVQDVLGKRVAWDATLRQLGQVLPANVWLTDLTASSPTPTDAAASSGSTTGFTMNGYTYTPEDVAALLQRLQLLPTLTAVTLGSTSSTTIGKKTVVQFQITAGLQAAPAEAQP